MQQEINCSFSIGPLLGQVITWLIVLIGWFVVNNHNNKRELRRELRALTDSLILEIDQVAIQAIEFHKNEHFDPSFAKQIKLRIQRIANNIHRNSLVSDSKATYHFRKSITGANFDSSSFTPQTDISSIIDGIWEEKDELIEALEEKYCQIYRQKRNS